MYCHTNNLAVVQEATIGAGQSIVHHGIQLDTGGMLATIVPPQLGQPQYAVWIAGDPLDYEFPDFASAADFIAEEIRLHQ